jgi:hypothetical protein
MGRWAVLRVLVEGGEKALLFGRGGGHVVADDVSVSSLRLESQFWGTVFRR